MSRPGVASLIVLHLLLLLGLVNTIFAEHALHLFCGLV